ncbi:MAG: hypothetical protein IK117_07085 [Bacteroidales bacterium]|nr:hypothetical protein [Bacteroidales bacterium]
MSSQKDLFDKIQKIYQKNPNRLNIIEEQIDLDIQMNYFKRSAMLKKQVVTLDEVLAKVPALYDADARLEEKRDILILLASFEDIDTFRFLEKYKNEAVGEIKLWASMAYRESKLMLESSLLEDDDRILISTGLGGKGTNLRYFVCLVHKDEEFYTEIQDKIIRNEIASSVEKYGAELESLVIENHLAKIFLLVPIDQQVKDIVGEVVDASEELGGFLDKHVIITNVRAFSNEEISQIVHDRLREEDLLGIDFIDDEHSLGIDDDDEDDEQDDDFDGDSDDDDELF